MKMKIFCLGMLFMTLSKFSSAAYISVGASNIDSACRISTNPISQLQIDTATLRTDLTQVALSTGSLRDDLNQVKTDTGTLATELTAVKLDTITLRNETTGYALKNYVDSIAIDTGILNNTKLDSSSATATYFMLKGTQTVSGSTMFLGSTTFNNGFVAMSTITISTIVISGTMDFTKQSPNIISRSNVGTFSLLSNFDLSFDIDSDNTSGGGNVLTFTNHSGANKLMTMKENGNFGIGTNNPSSKLAVWSNSATQPTFISSNTFLGIEISSAGTIGMGIETINQDPTKKLDVNGTAIIRGTATINYALETPRAGITVDGGNYVTMIWTSTSTSVKGTIVQISSGGYTQAVTTCAANSNMPMGIIYEAGVAQGAYVQVVISGLAQVLMKDGTQTGAGDWLGVSDVDGCATAQTSPPADTTHDREVGHCVQDNPGGTNQLVWAIIHFR